MRIGHGFDVHPLVAHRPLMLGGILIPYHQGLLGHSDGDCLLHAICDALLGAAGLGDIGQHFPPGDPAFKDIDSKILLARVHEKSGSAGKLPILMQPSWRSVQNFLPILRRCAKPSPQSLPWMQQTSTSRRRPPKDSALLAEKKASPPMPSAY